MQVRGSQRKSVEVYMVVCGRRRKIEKVVEVDGSRRDLLDVYENVEVHGSLWKLVEVLEVGGHFMKVSWKLLEVYETRGSRWKYIGAYGSSLKLPPNLVVETAIDGSNRNFHIHRQWQLPSTSSKISINQLPWT